MVMASCLLCCRAMEIMEPGLPGSGCAYVANKHHCVFEGFKFVSDFKSEGDDILIVRITTEHIQNNKC